MEIIRLQSGLTAHRLNATEQKQLWKELSVDVSPIGKDMPQYVPNSKMEYFIVSTTETSNWKYTTVLKIKGKNYTCKHNDCNQDEKMYKLIRQVYEKQ